MSNQYTDTSSNSLGGTVGGAGLVQKAYDRLLEFALRAEPLIRSVADKRPARQAMPGQTVVLQKYTDLNAFGLRLGSRRRNCYVNIGLRLGDLHGNRNNLSSIFLNNYRISPWGLSFGSIKFRLSWPYGWSFGVIGFK